jgi:predicted phage tail protein
VRDIITGAVLIGIGFAFGGSVFLGDFSTLNIIFDGLGVFFIVKGVIKLLKSKQAA